MTRLHVGRSEKPDLEAAAVQAASEALAHAVHPALAILLATEHYDPQPLAAAMSQALGNLPWVGCSAAAVIAGTELLRQGLVVGVIDSADAYVGVGAAGPLSHNPRASGAAAVARALDQMPAWRPDRGRAFIVLLNPLGGDAAEALRGAVHEGGAAAAWAGGGAGDNLRNVRTAQFARGRAFFDNVVVAALDLPHPVGAGMRHGWKPYGPPTLVTRARGPIACELEYEPAFEIYRRVAASRGDRIDADHFAAFAMTHPLGIPQADGEHVIRDPLAVEPDGGLRCVTEVPDGSLVRVMHGGEEALIAAAYDAALQARTRAGGPLAGGLVFDCVSRFLTLGHGFERELAAFQSALGAEVPVMGCLTLGEVGVLGAGLAQYHNKTAAVLALPA